MFVGVVFFLAGDRAVERKFGDEGAGGAMGIVVGSVVDGVPESITLGIQLAAGIPLSVSFIVAVWVSNIPQAIAPSADLAASGWGAPASRTVVGCRRRCVRDRGSAGLRGS
jgi:ZIP family zinc transporter